MKCLNSFTLFVFIFVASINTYGEKLVEGAILEEKQVLEIAADYLSKTDIETEEFYIKSVLYNKEQKVWSILYLDRNNTVGGLFLLSIEDKQDPKISIAGGA